MASLLAGRLDLADYRLLLRQLQPLYATLEEGLDRHAADPAIAAVRLPEIYRAPALAADLAALPGPAWPTLPLQPAAVDYVARLQELAERWPPGLVAHAYVRYMGDLSGGRVVGTVVRRTYADAVTNASAFYDHGPGVDADAIKHRLRAGLDNSPLAIGDADRIVAEAVAAFARHADLFEELTPLGRA